MSLPPGLIVILFQLMVGSVALFLQRTTAKVEDLLARRTAINLHLFAVEVLFVIGSRRDD